MIFLLAEYCFFLIIIREKYLSPYDAHPIVEVVFVAHYLSEMLTSVLNVFVKKLKKNFILIIMYLTY